MLSYRNQLLDGAESLPAVNAWLEDNVRRQRLESTAFRVPNLFGFFMGFPKDHGVFEYKNNILLRGNKNFMQGECAGLQVEKCAAFKLALCG